MPYASQKLSPVELRFDFDYASLAAVIRVDDVDYDGGASQDFSCVVEVEFDGDDGLSVGVKASRGKPLVLVGMTAAEFRQAVNSSPEESRELLRAVFTVARAARQAAVVTRRLGLNA